MELYPKCFRSHTYGSCIKNGTGTSSPLASALGNNTKTNCPVADSTNNVT